MTQESKHPNPGSLDAIEKGCLCPVLDNGHGQGAWGGIQQGLERQPLFWINAACPIHGKSQTPIDEADQVEND